MADDRILIVDDDRQILEAFKRWFSGKLDVHTAEKAEEGLGAVTDKGPYAVVVSDYRMPVMNGVELLSRIKERSPDTVRILLTGYADLKTAIEAVNKGHIFRLLTKPCPSSVLLEALTAGIRQYRLVIAERELLEKTLVGSIGILTELLSLIKPDAFGRSSRIESMVGKIAVAMGIGELWEIRIAAALSQLGLLVLPDGFIRRICRGRPHSADDYRMFKEHPKVAAGLIAKIPRLETVAAIVAYQEKHFDGEGIPEDARKGDDIPVGARILKAAIDFDVLTFAGMAKGEALLAMKERAGVYDPGVLAALTAVLGAEARYAVQIVSLIGLKEKMIVGEDIFSVKPERKLLAKGYEISSNILEHLRRIDQTIGVKQPITVIEPLSNR